MKTKLLGQNKKTEVEKSYQPLNSIFKYTNQNDLFIDDQAGKVVGYVLEGVLPNTPDQKIDPREVYITMDSSGLNVYLDKGTGE